MSARTAVVLASGGLDSTTCMAIAKDQGFDLVAVSFSYGQRHAVELEAAARVCHHYGITRHLVFELGLFKAIGQSALTDDIPVPQGRSLDDMAEGIPVTYVPARNLVFLSHAVGVAETHGAEDIFIGVNAIDYSGYPDCRPEFIERFTDAARIATKAGTEGGRQLRIHTPLIAMTKAEIVQLGETLEVPYHLTHSCYHPTDDGASCGRCDSCLLRLKGFAEAGSVDPVRYAGPSATGLA
jgi:7-cyano-7-deazaguanine synthase